MARNSEVLPGMALVAALAASAWGLAQWDVLRQYGASPLTLAILFGAVLGNTFPGLGRDRFRPGLAFAQRRLLLALPRFHMALGKIPMAGPVLQEQHLQALTCPAEHKRPAGFFISHAVQSFPRPR